MPHDEILDGYASLLAPPIRVAHDRRLRGSYIRGDPYQRLPALHDGISELVERTVPPPVTSRNGFQVLNGLVGRRGIL